MKRLNLVLSFALLVILAFAQFPLLDLGDKAPLTDLKMMDISGKTVGEIRTCCPIIDQLNLLLIFLSSQSNCSFPTRFLFFNKSFLYFILLN